MKLNGEHTDFHDEALLPRLIRRRPKQGTQNLCSVIFYVINESKVDAYCRRTPSSFLLDKRN